MEERLDFIIKDVDFNTQQKLAKADGERMRLRGTAAVITSSGTIPVESKRGAHPAQLIATSTIPGSQRNRPRANGPRVPLQSASNPVLYGAKGEERRVGLSVCGSGVQNRHGEGGACEDCGGIVTHG